MTAILKNGCHCKHRENLQWPCSQKSSLGHALTVYQVLIFYHKKHDSPKYLILSAVLYSARDWSRYNSKCKVNGCLIQASSFISALLVWILWDQKVWQISTSSSSRCFHHMPDPIPETSLKYKSFVELYGTITTEQYRPRLHHLMEFHSVPMLWLPVRLFYVLSVWNLVLSTHRRNWPILRLISCCGVWKIFCILVALRYRGLKLSGGMVKINLSLTVFLCVKI